MNLTQQSQGRRERRKSCCTGLKVGAGAEKAAAVLLRSRQGSGLQNGAVALLGFISQRFEKLIFLITENAGRLPSRVFCKFI